MNSVLSDLRHALRLYAKTPASSALVIAGLATAMAILTAFLSAWSVLELKPHEGFEGRDDLITIGRNDGRLFFPISRSIIEHINDEAATIDAIAGVAFSRQTLEHESESENIATEVVTDGFFEAVGPRLQIGRGFTTADHRAEAEPVAVLSYALWQRDYGGRTEALGSTIRIRGRNPFSFGGDQAEVSQDYRIVGVLVPGMRGVFNSDVDVWLPYEQVRSLLYRQTPDRELAVFRGLARLAPGASVEDARVELAARSAALSSDEPGLLFARLDAVDGIVSDANAYRDVRRQVRLFLAGSLLLMLTAASNVSLFLLSRAPGRRRELAVRLAVGALPRRLARQLITEAGLLVAAATLIGGVASVWLATMVPRLSFLRRLPWPNVTVLDWRVLAIAAGLALFVAVLVSLAPIASLRRLVVNASGQRSTARSAWGQRLAGAAQVALAVVVAAAAVAFIWHLADLSAADRGFSAPNVLVIRPQPPQRPTANADRDAADATRERRREVIAGLPGVSGVSFASVAPGVLGLVLITPIRLPADPTQTLRLDNYLIDPAYFRLLGMTLRHGRMLEATDRDNVVVNEALARALWGRTDVAGERLDLAIRPGDNGPPSPEIVGVIGDVAFNSPSEAVPPAAFRLVSGPGGYELILVETRAEPAAFQAMLQQRIDSGELDLKIDSVRRVEEAWLEQLAPDRARMNLTIVSALIVLVLAATGYYGTQRYLVTAGRREHAILAALGARPRDIYRGVLLRGLAFGAPGLVVGSVLAFAVVRWLQEDFISSAVSPSVVTAVVAFGVLCLLLGATNGPALDARDTDPAPPLKDE